MMVSNSCRILTRIRYLGVWMEVRRVFLPGGEHAEDPRRDPARRNDRGNQCNDKG